MLVYLAVVVLDLRIVPFIYCACVCRHLFMVLSPSIATFSETTMVCTLCVYVSLVIHVTIIH